MQFPVTYVCSKEFVGTVIVVKVFGCLKSVGTSTYRALLYCLRLKEEYIISPWTPSPALHPLPFTPSLSLESLGLWSLSPGSLCLWGFSLWAFSFFGSQVIIIYIFLFEWLCIEFYEPLFVIQSVSEMPERDP